MKNLIFLGILFTTNSWSGQLELIEVDQAKLARMLEQLPAEFRDKIYEPRIVKTIFPKNGMDSAFLIVCTSHYYNSSEIPSASTCELKIDVNHRDFEKGYDELRGTFKNRDWVRPFSNIIPYGKPRKEVYSYGRDEGIKFNGKKGRVFHYHFSCSTEDCIFDFSEKVLKN